MNLLEQKRAALKGARDIMEKARTEGREPSESELVDFDTRIEEADKLDKLLAKADSQKARMDRLKSLDDGSEPDADRDRGEGNTFVKGVTSLGEHYVTHAKAKLAGVKGSRFSVDAPEYKAAADVHVTPGVGAGMGPLVTQYDTTVVQGLRRRLYVADLLGSGTISGNALTYFIEGAFEGSFTTVAENAVKPQMHVGDALPVTEALRKVAGYIKESDEMIEDFPFLVSAINNRLLYNLALFEEDQLINGNGTGTNLRGLLQRSGIQTVGLLADSKTGNLDTLFKAITMVETGSGFFADGIVINPTDYMTFRLSKDANGQYYAGGPFTGPYGVGGIMERPPLWGVRTVVTPAIAAGTVLVGAFQPAAEVLRKGGVRVESTNSNEADFISNRVTIRAEERLLLAVRYPSALVKVTLGAAA